MKYWEVVVNYGDGGDPERGPVFWADKRIIPAPSAFTARLIGRAMMIWAKEKTPGVLVNGEVSKERYLAYKEEVRKYQEQWDWREF